MIYNEWLLLLYNFEQYNKEGILEKSTKSPKMGVAIDI